MGIKNRVVIFSGICYAALTLALYPIPVFNILHAESMLVIALGGFFIAGMGSLRLLAAAVPLRHVIPLQAALLAVPWSLLTLNLLWTPNCGYFQGLLFFFLFPLISVVFAASVAFLIYQAPVYRKGIVLTIAGVLLVALPTVYDLLLHPQLYVYNHVFGGFLGPIYDEELAVRPGLFVFRALTLLWSALLLCAAMRLRRGASGKKFTLAGGILVLPIGFIYLFSPQLGINTPSWIIQERLGGHIQTDNFDIYYDPASVDSLEARYLARHQEFRYEQLSRRLDTEVSKRIETYLYPSPEVKASLTGARYTSVAPVWQRTPQVHLLRSRFDRSFAHELAHVFSREFGLPVVRTSVSIGLVEGLAVALEPPRGGPGPHELVAAAVSSDVESETHLEDLSGAVRRYMTVLGFWGGRGAVSYATMGSFVKYLLDAYGPEPLTGAYKFATFEEAFHKPLDQLIEEWEVFISDYPVSDVARIVMTARFSVPSLFEQPCPHYIPPHIRAVRSGRESLARADTSGALAAYERSLHLMPGFTPALNDWARIKLSRNQPGDVISRLVLHTGAQKSFAPLVRTGDALALLGDSQGALEQYEQALRLLPDGSGEERTVLTCRMQTADKVDVVRALYEPIPPEVRGRRMLALDSDDACVPLIAAYLMAEGGAHDQALATLEDVYGTAMPEQMKLQVYLWLTEYAIRAGVSGTGIRFASTGALQFEEAKDPHGFGRMVDMLEELEWMAERGETIVSEVVKGRTVR